MTISRTPNRRWLLRKTGARQAAATVTRYTSTLVYGCILISGAAALIYEVVWARQLTLFLGITTYAHTAVLTAYMAGSAAGSVFIGRLADRHPAPLRLYAQLEIGIGLYALTTPWLFTAIQNLYAVSAPSLGLTGVFGHMLRFTLALVALLVPTFLMGGTLPLLVRGLTASLKGLARWTGRLYGINTLGATLGAFAAGYLLLPALGMRGTVFLAVVLSVGVGLTILALQRQLPTPLTPQPKPTVAPPSAASSSLSTRAGRILLLGFAVSGCAALIYEIAWIRALTLVIGSSVYAFSTTLTTFLAGIAVGSLLYARFPGRHDADTRLRRSSLLQIGVSITAIMGLAIMGLLPDLFLRGYAAGLQEHFIFFQAFVFGLCFLIMFGPTLMLGALFPLITAIWTRDAAGMGRGVGTAYAANAAGTILGSLMGGLVLLPTLGVQGSLLLAAGLSAAVAAAFWIIRPTASTPQRRFGPALAAVPLFALAVVLVPDWNRAVMSAGVYSNPGRFLQAEGETMREKTARGTMLYYKEGIDGVVSVVDNGQQRRLVINGKTDASSIGDLPTQVMLGQLPLLLHPRPEKLLVIGLGSGITVGSAATHESVSQLDVLEISPEVVAASNYFSSENGSVLTDPRVNLVVADARNFVLAKPDLYDVIISEPSNPWISGISNLFTQDFFRMAQARLAPGGIMAQWFHTYNMSTEDLKTVLHTYHAVFPYVSVWMPLPGDLILIGSHQPHYLDHARFQQALNQPTIQSNLAEIGVGATEHLVDMFLLGQAELAPFTDGAPLNTDDRPRIEFNAPRNLYASTTGNNLVAILQHLDGLKYSAPISGLVASGEAGLLAPFIGLRVIPTGDDAPSNVVAKWLVERHPVQDAANQTQLAVGNQGFITWQAGEMDNQLLATEYETAPAPDAQQATLQSVMVGGLIQGGQVDLPGGLEGIWAIGPGEKPERIAVGIAWMCSDPAGGVTSYVSLQLLPDPGAENWGGALLDSAQRFRCVGKGTRSE